MEGQKASNQYETTLHVLSQILSDYNHAARDLQNMSVQLRGEIAAASKRFGLIFEEFVQRSVSSSLGECVLKAPQTKSALAEAPGFHLMATPTTPTLEVYCLGVFQARTGWTTIQDWHSIKAKSLLKYLITQQGHPVSKEVLMEALWPGCDPQLANNNLRAAVRALRQSFYQTGSTSSDFAWVLFQDGNYMINPEVDVWTDDRQFEYHWTRGCRLERAGELGKAIAEFESAEIIYKGDYLEDDRYEDWTFLRREALKDTYLALLGKLGDYFMSTGDSQIAINYCQKVIARDCCREDAYRRLMICHNRVGNRNRALQWYKLCEKTINTELGLPPDRQTQMVYQQLLNGEII